MSNKMERSKVQVDVSKAYDRYLSSFPGVGEDLFRAKVRVWVEEAILKESLNVE